MGLKISSCVQEIAKTEAALEDAHGEAEDDDDDD